MTLVVGKVLMTGGYPLVMPRAIRLEGARAKEVPPLCLRYGGRATNTATRDYRTA